MPAAAAAAIAAAFPATAATAFTLGATAVSYAAVIGTALVAGGTLALSASQASRAKRKAKDAYNAAQVDHMANVVTSVAPRELVLGRVRKGGAIFFRGSTGANKETLVFHVALAGHEIDAVEQVYLNDVAVTRDADDYVTTEPYYQARKESRTATIAPGDTSAALPSNLVASSVYCWAGSTGSEDATGVFAVPFTLSGTTVSISEAVLYPVTVEYQTLEGTSYARVREVLGAPGAAADQRTIDLFPDLWTAAHRAEGVAYLVVELTYNETAFPSGVPVVTALVRGAKVYDPRDASTAWSDNPALLMRHVYQHAQFGKATISAAEDARFIAAANACDTLQVWDDGVTAQTEPLYRAHMVAAYGTAAKDVLDDLAQAMAGMWAFAGGELYVRAGVYTASVLSLTDADLAVIQRQGEQEEQAPIAISPHRERAQKFNTVNLRIWDEDQDYKQVGLTPVKGSALITRDGEELAQEVTLAAVTFAPQAQHVAGIMMRDARDPLTIEVTCKLRAWPLEIFDTVDLTLARYGWSAKTFMVLSRTWDRARGTVRLLLKETGAAIYSPAAAFLPQGYARNTALPRPWQIDPPFGLTARSTTGDLGVSPSGGIVTRVRVHWAAVQDVSLTSIGRIEVQWADAEDREWQSVTTDASATELFLVGPADGQLILLRARSRNSVAVSDWSSQVAHLVVGQTERPAAVSGLSVLASNGFAVVSWTLHTALDVLYGGEIVVRHSPLTTGATWEDGVILDAFDGRAVSGIVPLLTGTYMAKAKDRAGNWSETAATFVATEGMVTGFITVATSTQDPTFSGGKTAVVATDNILKLDSTTLIDDMTASIDTWGTIDLLGGIDSEGTYLFDTHVDLGTVAVRRFEVTLKVAAYEADDLIDSRSNLIDDWDAIDGNEVNDCDVTVYARTTNDDPAGTPTWGVWTPFMVADFACRAAQFKAVLTSGAPTHNINVEQLRVTVQEAA